MSKVFNAVFTLGARRPVTFLLLFFAFVHAALLVHDVIHPDSFTRGDRSFDRLGKTTYVFDGTIERSWFDQPEVLVTPTPGWIGRMAEVGPPGDYIVPGALYRYLGHVPTVLLQILVTLGAIILVYRIGLQMRLNNGQAIAGAAIFGLLPGTLVEAHMIVSETWAIPSLALACWLTLRLYRQGFSARLLTWVIAAWALTIFFRQQFVLIPIALMLLTAWQWRAGRQWVYAPLLLLAMVPHLAWSGVSESYRADWPELSASFTDVKFHLHRRLVRMSSITDIGLEGQLDTVTEVPYSLFVKKVVQYPATFARTTFSDNVDYVLNPGTAYLSRYLGVLPKQHMDRGWGWLRDQHGLTGMIWILLTSAPVFAAAMVSHAGLHGILLVLGLLGLVVWLVRPPAGISLASRLFVLGTISYSFLVIQVAYQSRWTLRQPVEVLFSPLVVFGWLQVSLWWHAWRAKHAGGQTGDFQGDNRHSENTAADSAFQERGDASQAIR